jgi:hypothetical protein
MLASANSNAVTLLKENWNSFNPANMGGALKAWTGLVKTGAIWDFKPDIIDGLGKDPTITLGGYEVNFQAVANLFYGFIGSEIGFPDLLLEGGAGAAQWDDWHESGQPGAVGPCNTTYYCDQPFDNWWINFGMYLHNLYGKNLDALTEEAFQNALNGYIDENGQPPSLP